MLPINVKSPNGNNLDIDIEGRAFVRLPGPINTVPDTANTQTHSFETFVIGNKGQSNLFTYRPLFQNENVAINDNVVTTLSGTSPSYAMQIFRASSTNVNTLAVTTKAIPVSTIKDAFTSVNVGTNSWNSSSAAKLTLSLDTTIGNYRNTNNDTNSQSLKFSWGNNVTGVNAYKPLSVSQDWSSVQTFSLYFKSSSLQTLYLKLSDGTNSFTWNFSNTATNVFEPKIFDIGSPTSISGSLNVSAITRFEIGAVVVSNNSLSWIDAFETQNAPGNLYAELWDFETNDAPTNFSLGTKLTLDNGTTQVQLPNPIVKTIQRAPLQYGVTKDVELKIGNYYGVVLYNGGSGTIEVYGSYITRYANGGSFTSPNAGGALSKLTNTSLYFCIFAYKDCYIRRLYVSTNAPPGQSRAITIIYNLLTKKRDSTLQNNMRFHNRVAFQLDFSDIPKKLDLKDTIIMNYVDDASSSASEVQIGIDAIFEGFKVWG